MVEANTCVCLLHLKEPDGSITQKARTERESTGAQGDAPHLTNVVKTVKGKMHIMAICAVKMFMSYTPVERGCQSKAIRSTQYVLHFTLHAHSENRSDQKLSSRRTCAAVLYVCGLGDDRCEHHRTTATTT